MNELSFSPNRRQFLSYAGAALAAASPAATAGEAKSSGPKKVVDDLRPVDDLRLWLLTARLPLSRPGTAMRSRNLAL
jgi:hypothetical protein